MGRLGDSYLILTCIIPVNIDFSLRYWKLPVCLPLRKLEQKMEQKFLESSLVKPQVIFLMVMQKRSLIY